MGDDFFNPWTSETHVKRVSFWQIVAAEAFTILVVVCAAWGVAILILSLERGSP